MEKQARDMGSFPAGQPAANPAASASAGAEEEAGATAATNKRLHPPHPQVVASLAAYIRSKGGVLPDGWSATLTVRPNGAVLKTFLSPAGGRFRSQVAVARELGLAEGARRLLQGTCLGEGAPGRESAEAHLCDRPGQMPVALGPRLAALAAIASRTPAHSTRPPRSSPLRSRPKARRPRVELIRAAPCQARARRTGRTRPPRAAADRGAGPARGRGAAAARPAGR
jgi:hypothetical protein